MNNTAVVTLIVVSAALTFFLIMLSLALYYLISILKQVKRMAAKAENVVGSVEAAAEAFEEKASSLAILKVISNIVTQASKFKKKG